MPKKTQESSCGNLIHKVGAIILGGGQGTRLQPLTKMRAKPAVPLFGRYRLIDIPMSNCIHSGINRIVLLTQFNSHSLHRHIFNTYKFDDFSKGYVQLLAAEQSNESGDWFQGTADAVRKQLIHIADSKVEYYIILSGDQLYRMDYRKMLATHIKKNADITVAALPVNRRDAQEFGIMNVRGNGRIHQFVEKPKDRAVLDELTTPEKVFNDFGLNGKGKPYLASMGIYIFNADVLERQLLDHPEWIDFGKEVLPKSLKSHKTFAHMFSGFWEDIGTVRSYFDIHMAMTSSKPPFELNDPLHPIYTHARALPGARILDAKISDSIICAGSVINKANIKQSIIGIRCVVQPGVKISEGVLLGNDYYEDTIRPGKRVRLGIGEGTKIHRAIIDHNARIGKNVVICGSSKIKDQETSSYSVRDGIVVVHKNATIPDGTVIK